MSFSRATCNSSLLTGSKPENAQPQKYHDKFNTRSVSEFWYFTFQINNTYFFISSLESWNHWYCCLSHMVWYASLHHMNTLSFEFHSLSLPVFSNGLINHYSSIMFNSCLQIAPLIFFACRCSRLILRFVPKSLLSLLSSSSSFWSFHFAFYQFSSLFSCISRVAFLSRNSIFLSSVLFERTLFILAYLRLFVFSSFFKFVLSLKILPWLPKELPFSVSAVLRAFIYYLLLFSLVLLIASKSHMLVDCILEINV